jgi:hypothetical protein
LDFPAPISPKSDMSPRSDVDAIEPCARQHQRGPSDDLDDETAVERSTSWAQYYHSVKAHRLLGC